MNTRRQIAGRRPEIYKPLYSYKIHKFSPELGIEPTPPVPPRLSGSPLSQLSLRRGCVPTQVRICEFYRNIKVCKFRACGRLSVFGCSNDTQHFLLYRIKYLRATKSSTNSRKHIVKTYLRLKNCPRERTCAWK